MPPEEDINTKVDYTSDIGDGSPSQSQQSQEDNAGTRQAGTDTEPADVRSLLNKAFKEDATGRVHGEDGKFVAKPADTAPPQQQQQQKPPEVQQQQPVIPDRAAFLSALPDEHRPTVEQFLLARETELQTQAQTLADRVRGYDSVEQLLAPRRQAWAINGMSQEAALTQLFALSDFAGRDPGEFIAWFAGQHNIDLATLGDTYEQPDPEIVRLKQEIAQLRSGQQNFQTQQQQQVHQGFLDQVNQFALAKNQDGTSVYPHFADIAEDMLHVIPAVRQANPALQPQDVLKEAYERCVWSNPTTRPKMLEAQQKAREAEQLEASARRAAAAKNAGQSLNGAPNTDAVPQVPIPADTVRGALEAAFAQHS